MIGPELALLTLLKVLSQSTVPTVGKCQFWSQKGTFFVIFSGKYASFLSKRAYLTLV